MTHQPPRPVVRLIAAADAIVAACCATDLATSDPAWFDRLDDTIDTYERARAAVVVSTEKTT